MPSYPSPTLGTVTMFGPLMVSSAGVPNHIVTTALNPNIPIVQDDAQIFSYYVSAASGGTAGDVASNARIYSSITGAPNAYVFNALNVVDYNGTGGNGQLVAAYDQAIRRTRNTGGASNNPEIFGAVMECIDFTNSDSGLTNSMSGFEIDMTCGNTDSANKRRGFGMYLNKANVSDVAPIVSLGMHLAANSGSYDTVLKIETPFNIAALDLRLANATVNTAHAIWLRSSNNIALDTPASLILQGDNSGGMIMAGSAGNPARIIYQPGSGVNKWWSGAWLDGSFYIADDTHGTNRLTIGSAGATTLNCSSLALFDVTTPVGKRTGWGVPTGTATRTTFNTASVTLPQLAEHLKALIDDLTAYGLIGA